MMMRAPSVKSGGAMASQWTPAFSSYFADAGLDLGWLGRQPLAAAEIERRHVLRRARAGERVEVPARLRIGSPGHVNADAWRAGLVPNTFVQ